MAKKKHLGVFIGAVWGHWEARFGTTFAVILAFVQYAVLAFADPQKMPGWAKWIKDFPPSIWLSVGAVMLFWACYAAWHEERTEAIGIEERRRKLEEELADRYPRLKGEIKLAYLDLGAHCYKGRICNSHGPCVLTLFIELVNHSKELAITRLPPSLKLRINGQDYLGEYVIPEANRLRMNDSNLKGDSTILDIFSFTIGSLGQGVFQKGYLRGGWLMFNLPEDSQNELDGHPSISGDVTITIKDTLGGEHRISRSTIELRLNMMA